MNHDAPQARTIAGVTFEALELVRIIRPTEATKITGRSKTSLWRDVKAGRLEAPLKLGPRSIGWRLRTLLTAYGED